MKRIQRRVWSAAFYTTVFCLFIRTVLGLIVLFGIDEACAELVTFVGDNTIRRDWNNPEKELQQLAKREHVIKVPFKVKEHNDQLEIEHIPEPPKPVKQLLGQFHLTWYCPCPKCVGKKPIVRTATGAIPRSNYTIAVDPKKIPLGSKVYIEGFGTFIAQDTGGAIKGNRIDIYVDSHSKALQNGRKIRNVYIIK